MDVVVNFGLLALSLLIFFQALYSLYLMLYTWDRPERLAASRGPERFIPPQRSFTALLPARHEEAVIYRTIKSVWATNYPKELLEIVVICHADDAGTIAEARRAVDEISSPKVRVETFTGSPVNKPRGLNVGLDGTRGEVVTVFDAEDDIDADIFNVVNTVMVEEGTGIVQAGVQLMNFRDHWFGVHNCLEYFFYFKSRLHFHAKIGMIPLGGNTVFIERCLMEEMGGWDQECLTEDADIGIRLSSLGEPIRVVYDAQHVTREETPDSVNSFVRQRTRWNQGFLQILRKGDWRELPRRSQRLLALYTLTYPVFHSAITLLWPVVLVAIVFLKVPVPIAMASFLPLYALLLQLVVNVVGAYTFAKEYSLKVPLTMPVTMSVTFLPFQFMLGYSALRAVYREIRRRNDWEKTSHIGAHRADPILGLAADAQFRAARNSVALMTDEAAEPLMENRFGGSKGNETSARRRRETSPDAPRRSWKAKTTLALGAACCVWALLNWPTFAQDSDAYRLAAPDRSEGGSEDVTSGDPVEVRREVIASAMDAPEPVASPEPVSEKPATNLHEVAVGEYLGSIAAEYYGEEKWWPLIWQKNRERVQRDGQTFDDPDEILSGWILEVPPKASDPKGDE